MITYVSIVVLNITWKNHLIHVLKHYWYSTWVAPKQANSLLIIESLKNPTWVASKQESALLIMESLKKNINFQIFLSLILFKTQNWIKVFHLKTKRIFGVKSSDVFGSPITIICMRYYIHNYISPWFRIQPFPSEFEILHPTLQTHASFSFFFSFTENSLLMVNNSRVCRH